MSNLADDVLRGAGEIAEHLLGSRSKKNRRKIYHMHARRALPTWVEGNTVVSTRSALERHYAAKQEAAVSETTAAAVSR
jgi:hypothetical protein